MNAVTSTDTIYSKAKLNAEPKGKKRSGRRPPRGILRFDREDVLLLIDSNGSILFERQLASPQTSIVRLADSFLIETKNQKDVRLIRMDYSGNVLWQREHPAKHISDNYWSDSAGYILMASTYSPRGFVVLDKDNGNLIGSKQFEKGYSIGPVMDMFYNKNKVYVSGLSRSPQGKTQFRTRIMELDENSSMKNLIDKKGLMIELSGGNNFLIYQSDSEQFSKREGLSSNDFKIELVNELPINGN